MTDDYFAQKFAAYLARAEAARDRFATTGKDHDRRAYAAAYTELICFWRLGLGLPNTARWT